MTIDSNNIHELLQRFFEGETTCPEEAALQEYFTSGRQLPPDLEPYREMFGWYADGMPEEASPEARPAPVMDTPVAPWRRLLRYGAAAAVAAVTVAGAWKVSHTHDAGCRLYADNYVERDGIIMSGAEIQAEIDAETIAFQQLEDELDQIYIDNQQTDDI